MWPFRRHVSPRTLDNVLLKYVRAELPKRLSLPESAMDNVTLRPFASERPSTLRHVGIPVYGRLVLRALLRPKEIQRLAGYRRLRWTYDKLELPVPRRVFIDDSPATRRRYGFALLAEEFIDGESIRELSAAQRVAALTELAVVAARLHSVTSLSPGRPGAQERGDVASHAAAQFAKWLTRLQRFGIDLDPARSRSLTEWYARTLARLAPERFPLIHGRLTAEGVLVVGGRRPVLTGMLNVQHWFAQVDLLLLEWLLEGEGARSEDALSAYFAARPHDTALTREAYEASRPVFVAAYDVHKASTHARNAMRDRLVAYEQAEQARDCWDRARDALKEAGAL